MYYTTMFLRITIPTSLDIFLINLQHIAFPYMPHHPYSYSQPFEHYVLTSISRYTIIIHCSNLHCTLDTAHTTSQSTSAAINDCNCAQCRETLSLMHTQINNSSYNDIYHFPHFEMPSSTKSIFNPLPTEMIIYKLQKHF